MSFAFVQNVHPPSESEITRCSLVGVDVKRVGVEEKNGKGKDWAVLVAARHPASLSTRVLARCGLCYWLGVLSRKI